MTLSGTVDTAVYVVLAVTYANTWLGQPRPVTWLMSLAVIALFAALNVRSLATMALSSAAFAVLILAPCAVLTVLGVLAWRSNPFVPLTPPGAGVVGSLGLGLTVAIWFYSGYESLSTMAGEIEAPQRVIPKALLLSIPAVVAVYLLPTMAGLASVGGWSAWGEGGTTFVQVASVLGGPWLALPVMAGALASSLALYNAYLAAGARTTLVMAERGLLPPAFGKVHPRFGTPWASILIAAAAHAVLVLGSLETLLVFDVFLFVMSYLLLFTSLVVLRVREPDLPRPFRIPVGTRGLAVLAGVPVAVGLLLLVANGPGYLAWGGLVAATGPVAYRVFDRVNRAVR